MIKNDAKPPFSVCLTLIEQCILTVFVYIKKRAEFTALIFILLFGFKIRLIDYLMYHRFMILWNSQNFDACFISSYSLYHYKTDNCFCLLRLFFSALCKAHPRQLHLPE